MDGNGGYNPVQVAPRPDTGVKRRWSRANFYSTQRAFSDLAFGPPLPPPPPKSPQSRLAAAAVPRAIAPGRPAAQSMLRPRGEHGSPSSSSCEKSTLGDFGGQLQGQLQQLRRQDRRRRVLAGGATRANGALGARLGGRPLGGALSVDSALAAADAARRTGPQRLVLRPARRLVSPSALYGRRAGKQQPPPAPIQHGDRVRPNRPAPSVLPCVLVPPTPCLSAHRHAFLPPQTFGRRAMESGNTFGSLQLGQPLDRAVRAEVAPSRC